MRNKLKQIIVPKVLVVDLNGGAQFTAIQAALDAQVADDVVFVLPGEYNEELTAKVNGTLFSFGGVRVRPTITVDNGNAFQRGAGVTEFKVVNVDFAAIVAVTAGGGRGRGVLWQGGTLTLMNCSVSAETATGMASDGVMRALSNSGDGSIFVHGGIIRAIDSGNLITTGQRIAVRLNGSGKIKLDGGVRIEAAANTTGDVISSDGTSNLELRNVFVEDVVQLVAIATASRTGATEIVGGVTGADAGKMTNISEASGGGGDPSAPFASASNAVTTSSNPSDVLVPNMTLTPASGNYLVWFNGDADHDQAEAGIAAMTIYSGGTLAADSESRARPGREAVGGGESFACMTKVTVNGSQAIEGRFRDETADGVVTITSRRIAILKVA